MWKYNIAPIETAQNEGMSKFKIGPYEEKDRRIFHGRSHEVEEMYHSFLSYDYIVCYAASGEGKSSILNAGLFPKLRENGYFPISLRDVLDGNSIDFDEKVNVIIDKTLKEINAHSYIIPPLIQLADSEVEWQESLISNNTWVRLRYTQFVSEDYHYLTPVLVFDQFEEVFNCHPESWTKQFFRWLETLSQDSCPEPIIEEITRVIHGSGHSEIPDLTRPKNFKAIFAMRSEYIANLDYWGVQRNFIPDLKNNRFFLKSLTPQGAKEVIEKGGLHTLGEDNIHSLIKGCAKEFDEKFPCIPAYVLSVVCHEIEQSAASGNKQKEIISLLKNDREKCIQDLLETFYKRGLAESGLDEAAQDKLEAALFDDDGNRRRIEVNDHRLDDVYLNLDKLINKHIIRVVSGKKDENSYDNRVIEFSHDRLQPVIKTRKERRMNELKTKLQQMKEWARFSFITTVLALVALSIYKLLGNVIFVYYSSWILNHNRDNDTVKKAIYAYFHLKSVNEDYMTWFETLSISFDVILNGVILTAISATVFKWDKLSRWVTCSASIIGMLGFGWLICRNLAISTLDLVIHITTYLGFILSLGALLTVFVPMFSNNRKKNRSMVDKQKNYDNLEGSYWPLWGGLLLFGIYCFAESIFRTSLGSPEHCDSYWALSVLPCLLCSCLWGIFRYTDKARPTFSTRHKVVIIVCLLLPTILFVVSIPFHLELGIWKWVAILPVFISCAIWMWYASTKNNRRIAYIGGVFVFLLAITIFQSGYNEFEIKYPNVAKVIPWRIVYVKDQKELIQDTTKIGVRDAVTGKFIVDYIINYDTTLFKKGLNEGGWIVANEGTFDNIDLPWGCNTDGSFCHYYRGVTKCRLPIAPNILSYENKFIKDSISSISLIEDSVNYYSALLYRQLRNQTIKFMMHPEDNKYSWGSLTAYPKLESVVHNAFLKCKTLLDVSKLDTVSYSYKVARRHVETITDKEMFQFLRQITRYFFLISLKDRIQQDDIANIASMLQTYIPVFFHDWPGVNFKCSGSLDINNGERVVQSSSNVVLSIEAKDKVYAWYYMFNALCAADLAYNKDAFIKRIENNNNFTDFLNNINKKVLDDYSAKRNKTIQDLSQAVAEGNGEKLEKSINDLIMQSNELHVENGILLGEEYFHKALLDVIDQMDLGIYVETESSFSVFRDEVVSIIKPIMLFNGNHMYYNVLATITKDLANVSMIRSYNSDNLIKYYNDSEEKRESTFNLFKSFALEDSLKAKFKQAVDSAFSEKKRPVNERR